MAQPEVGSGVAPDVRLPVEPTGLSTRMSATARQALAGCLADTVAALARSFNRMADSLQRGEERQRRLIADVAHELRTPLANLRGYLEALEDGVVAPGPEVFASLHEEAVLQQRIVDDLQDLALAEAGALVYHRSRVDLVELLETCRTAHQAVAETVFDRFWRADAARGRDTGGSGLGLAIARQIVTDHGGTIQVASEPGAGTAFVIRLPSAVP